MWRQILCSVHFKATAAAQLEQLMGGSELIKNRLGHFANVANKETPGALDDPATHRKRMPDLLKETRKKRIGRHRIYYSGNHQGCRYDVFYIKLFKKSGTDDEDDPKFQKRLIRLLSDESVLELSNCQDLKAPSVESST